MSCSHELSRIATQWLYNLCMELFYLLPAASGFAGALALPRTVCEPNQWSLDVSGARLFTEFGDLGIFTTRSPALIFFVVPNLNCPFLTPKLGSNWVNWRGFMTRPRVLPKNSPLGGDRQTDERCKTARLCRKNALYINIIINVHLYTYICVHPHACK